jgi:hypothetical protein
VRETHLDYFNDNEKSTKKRSLTHMIRKIHLSAVSKSTCLAAILLVGAVFAMATNAAAVTGPYFGQTPPGTTPQLFAPGILSLSNRLEDHVAFSPDGNECFFVVWGANFSSASINWWKSVNNSWTSLGVAPFSAGLYASSPSFSADDNKLFFKYANDIWMVQRTADGWSDRQVLPAPINSSYAESGYSETAGGTSYFYSNRPGGQGTTNLYDIWRTRQVPGQPLQAENLGPTVNSTAADYDPCVARDGSYLIFTSERPGGIGYSDLYVSFANGNGGLTAPVNLNNYCPGINLAGYTTVGPSLSTDGRFLFFTRYRNTGVETEDVYWVANPLYVPEPATVIQLGLMAIILGLAGIRRMRSRNVAAQQVV